MDPKSVMYICRIYPPTPTHTLHISGLFRYNLHAAAFDLFGKHFYTHNHVTTITVETSGIFITSSPHQISLILPLCSPSPNP